VAEDWFRLPDWDAEARADFERRLGRARSHSRAQYLRIKGLALESAGEVEGARELWQRVLTDDGEFARMEAWSASEHLGDSYADDDPDKAITYYRKSMRGNRRLNATTATQHIKIAELLIARGASKDLDDAAKLLERWPAEADLLFPSAHFRWNVAVIDLAEANGDRDSAREAAARALELAGRGPVFPRHKTVGVVDGDRRTIERLERLVK
jgi:tetratricopeptide (TPR) repeat protein